MAAFVITFLALPFVGYALAMWRRRVRCRRAASELGAQYVERGLFQPGAIVGDRFTVEPVKIGRTLRTEVRIRATSSLGAIVFRRDFFRADPDWTRAHVRGETTQRVFCFAVTLPGFVEPTAEQRAAWLAWLDPRALDSSFASALAAARIGELVVADGFVTAQLPGIALDSERLRRALDLLGRIVREDEERGARGSRARPAAA